MAYQARSRTTAAECTICYDRMERNLSACPCGHVFHFHCILRWLQDPKHRQCPQCREACHERDLLSLFYECDVSEETPSSPFGPSASSAGTYSKASSSSLATSSENSMLRESLDRATIQSRKLHREKMAIEAELNSLKAVSEQRKSELMRLRESLETKKSEFVDMRERNKNLEIALYKEKQKAHSRRKKLDEFRERLFEAEKSKLVGRYAMSGRLDELEKSMKEYEEFGNGAGQGLRSGPGSSSASSRSPDKQVNRLRKMLQVQNTALESTREDYRRVALEKRKMAESLEHKEKQLEFFRAELKERGRMKNVSKSVDRRPFEVYHDKSDDDDLKLESKVLDDFGAYVLSAKSGKRSKNSKLKKDREEQTQVSRASSSTPHLSSAISSSVAESSHQSRASYFATSKQKATSLKDLPKWGKGFGSGSGKLWTNPTPFNDANGKYVKGGYDGMGGLHNVLTLPPKRRGSKRRFAADPFDKSAKSRLRENNRKKRASLRSWLKRE